MNISITPELKAFIDAKVATGGYGNASEVIREAVRRFKEYEEARVRIRAQIEHGWAQAQRGELIDGDVAFAQIDEAIAQAAARPRKRA